MNTIEMLVRQYHRPSNNRPCDKRWRPIIRARLYLALMDSGMGASNSREIEAITRKVKELLG